MQNAISGLQGVIDHVMVGHYVGYQGNAAIGVSWQIFVVVVVFVASLSSGMAVLVARYVGRGDAATVNRVVYQGLLAGFLLFALVLAPLGYLLSPTLLELVHAAPEVQAEALPYLRILFVFSVGMLFFYLFGGALRAAGDARTPLRLGALLTILNIVLSVVLIRGLGPIPAFGTRGAAIGTVAAAGVVMLLAGYLLFSHHLVVRFSLSMGLRPDWEIMRSLFRFGLPTGFQGIAMNVGGVILVRYVGALELSAAAQAAYAVGYTQLFTLVAWTSVALMSAAAAVAGQNLGADKPERAARAPLHAALIGLLFALPMSLLYAFAHDTLLGLFGIRDPDVLALGGLLLVYLSISAPFLTTALAYTGALQGTGDTRSPMVISIIAQLVLPIGLCASLDAWRGLSAADIWTAIVLGHVTRGVLSVWRFHQGRWRHIKVDVGTPFSPQGR